jgi:hypothetical protein
MMLNKNIFVSIAIISVFLVQVFPVSPAAEAAPLSGLFKLGKETVRASIKYFVKSKPTRAVAKIGVKAAVKNGTKIKTNKKDK